ncbi:MULTISPECIES: porin [Glaesserella]|uniref:Porin n=1 Tax=Glaesserella australis TaxID=2094024 RepID=A0A328C2A9_9PAST|nr:MULTISPECIES: porin [Glaesserella]AUI66354.1 porin [Glaesserella sp. 15-184]RAL19432.1 porin [Glaesserella australis]
MKKALFTLSALAMAASSAQAYTLIDNQETGTKLDFSGSLRLKWQSSSEKTENYEKNTTKRNHVNRAVANDGSRFGFKLTQQIANGFYGIGRAEWRFRGTAPSQHNFDDIYTRQLYVGIGHKQYGELTYGHMATITDEVKRTDLPNTLSLSGGLLNGSSRKVAQYTYSGIKGLKLGAFYGGHSQRGNDAKDLTDERKDIWGAAAIYNHKIDELQSVKLGTGVSRERFEQRSTGHTYGYTAYSVGTAYTYDKTTVGIDLERGVTNDQGTIGNKRVRKEVRTVLYQQLTKDWSAYTMYAYKTDRLDRVSSADTNKKTHEFMLGTEYYIVPKYLKTFVEWKTAKANNYTNGVKSSKVRNNETVIGLRAYW